MVEDFLGSKGYTLLSLADGNNFFATIDQFQPDLILLDLKLPYIDGYTLLRQLKQSQWQDLPVVVLSAYAFDHEKQKAFKLGAGQYLTKPARLEEILGAIEAGLRRDNS